MTSWLSSSAARALVLGAACASAGSSESDVVSHVAFGSCSKHDRRQPLWEPIVASKPDMFIWLGDAVYGDKMVYPGSREPEPMDVVKGKYDKQKARADYKLLLDGVPRVLGTWDDHDFGCNNCGNEYVDKDESQQLFLDFIDESKDSTRRTRAGLYESWTYGPKGKRVTVILLDTRYFKNDGTGEILGETQWQWLEKTLEQHSDSNLYLIGSGIQVLQSDRPVGERWAMYPNDKQRLFDTLARADLAGVSVLLSGDVHFGELTCAEAGLNHPLLELTSSGMTHAWGETGEFSFFGKWVGYLARAMLLSFPARYQLNSIEYQRNISAVHGANYHPYINYGSVDIDWEGQSVSLAVHGEGGAVGFNHTVSFNKTVFLGPEGMVSCRSHLAWYDWVAPHMSRMVVAVAMAVLTLDCWLVLYLVAMCIPQPSSFDEKEKKK